MDERLQSLLKWAYDKSLNNSSSYSRTTVCAFYLSLLAMINTIDESIPPFFSDWWERDFSQLLSKLDSNIGLDVDYGCGAGFCLGNFSGSLEEELALDRNLCHARAHASLLSRSSRLDEVRYVAEKNEWMLRHNEEDFEFWDSLDYSNLDEILFSLDDGIKFCRKKAGLA